MLLIPWFHPNIFMEGAKAFDLKDAVQLILSQPKTTGFIFLRIKDDRSVDIVSQDQLLKFGQYWLVSEDGLITGIHETINEIKEAIDGRSFKVGWSGSGLCVTPTTKAFVHQIKNANKEELDIELDDFHGVQFIL